MPDNRYLKIYFNKIKNKHEDKDDKYNWYMQVKVKFFEIINKTELMNQLTLERLILEKKRLLD